jgi:DNA (cytosine-5)-methyltransferase 1
VNGGSQHPDKRKAGGHGPTLADEVEFLLLPTPRTTDSHSIGHHGRGGQDLRTTIAYLPTPTATDAKGGRNATANRTKTGHHSGTMLTDAFWDGGPLLPTPRATDGTKGGPNQRGSAGDLMLPSAVQGNRWGDYALAIARWEIIMRRDAPAPTEPGAAWHRWRRAIADRLAGTDRRPVGRRGTITAPEAAHRRVLAVRLVEWMMGLPDGWVTDIDIPRNAKLRLLGNGVVPPQAAAAVRLLLNRTES